MSATPEDRSIKPASTSATSATTAPGSAAIAADQSATCGGLAAEAALERAQDRAKLVREAGQHDAAVGLDLGRYKGGEGAGGMARQGEFRRGLDVRLGQVEAAAGGRAL